MSQKNIILTGFMGTGKSTLGRRLALELGYRFIDTDTEIESRVGRTIAELFQEQGEQIFRQREEELVRELARQQGLVISTGGGLVMNPRNVTALQASGQIICLTASPEEILERVSAQQHIRPLLQEKNPLNKIKVMLQERDPIYSSFKQFSTSKKTQEELVSQLLEWIRNS